MSDLVTQVSSSPQSPKRSSWLRALCAVMMLAVPSVTACAAVEDTAEELTGDDHDDVDEDDEEVGQSSDALKTAGPCAGTAIDRAVKCAQAKGARVLSFYRSPAEQERVRRQNGCVNRCSGQAGCVRPTAGCNSSPHTACRAVDLVADGAPLSKAALRSCGLAKTTAPHKNHYDLVR